MIPKTIHYCWFGRGKKPHLIRKCIESWRRVMPDYEIKEWNEDNFNINILPFVRGAYDEKKWAFVADVCRFHALYSEGGIYLDTDVEVFKRFDDFLDNSCFLGTEVREVSGSDDFVTADSSTFGSEKGHWLLKKCLDWYNDKPFRREDGKISAGTVQAVSTRVLENYGYRRENQEQTVKDVRIYPTSVFTNLTQPYDRDQVYSLHHFDGSWTDSPSRGRLFKFCRKHDLMHWYRWMENFKLLWLN